jgi:hypothetical protein
MRKIALLVIVLFSVVSLPAQQSNTGSQKFDTVYMKNGDLKVGSITAVDDGSISFVYKGETLKYTLKKPDITKMVFSSGRVENITTPDSAAENNSTNTIKKAEGDHHNKAAVLPFTYINPSQETNIEMGYKVQNECYNILSGKAATFTIQDPATTNAFLGKSGVTPESIRNYTISELCDILGVEYVVRGTVTANVTGVTTSGNTTYDESKNKGPDKNGNNNSKTSGNVNSSSSSHQDFKTSVLMEMYTDDGKKVYGQDHTSFWSTVGAYKNALQFLLKKTPIYGK